MRSIAEDARLPGMFGKEWIAMENIIWFLLIGGLFFWMMRKGGGCCGGHGSHGDAEDEHRHHESTGRAEKEEPVKTAKRGCH
ncbi:MAG: hypothetical protein ACE5JL_17530 [Dehalococcoidia bacterium]